MDKKINIPKKGASRKLAEKLKELGEQQPPEELMKILNNTEESKKVATTRNQIKDLDI